MEDILNYVKEKFPQLKEKIKWSQPMFSDHGTFIIGLSIAKGPIAVSPEMKTINIFEDEINKVGYTHTQMLFRIKWMDKIDFNLLDNIINYNIEDKKDMTKFWR